MSKNSIKIRLQELLDNELSLSHDKKHVISAYDTLINILQTPEIHKHLSKQSELLFKCISQIILTSFNQYFHDDQLRILLELTLKTNILSITQNQIISNWLQNIEERIFEISDSDDDVTESEEDEKITRIKISNNNNNMSKKNASNQHQQKCTYNRDSSHHDLSSASARDKIRPLKSMR
ncbi:unnamed protein product [Rotaria sp. Silwood2]|nr:unnamed protein product [Rotaria sp. Silwood2]CAF3049755.1 unnamed protein product [Rotaria sp. Silwood2]CAF4037832.1 unnamed protein product [Rotaria sp. Silwood2]CAF4170861.1 unnamed protein product [Rotaria sp. Silwood2]